MRDQLLEVSELSVEVSLGNNERLRTVSEVDFSASKGSSVAIIGRSGSGKTSFLSVLGLLNSKFSGEYHFSGQDVRKLKDHERSQLRSTQMGFIFQSYSLVGHLNALSNVELPLRYVHGRERIRNPREKARQALMRVGLGDRLTAMPRHLSGGEQQRVAIARALVNNPQVVFADEPTGALDISTGDAVMEMLLGLVQDQECTLVMVTHDMDRAKMCDQIWRMDSARLFRSRGSRSARKRAHTREDSATYHENEVV